MGNSEEEQRNSGTAEQQSKMKFAVVNILVVLVGLSYLQYASAKPGAVKVLEKESERLGGKGDGNPYYDLDKVDGKGSSSSASAPAKIGKTPRATPDAAPTNTSGSSSSASAPAKIAKNP